MNTIRDHRRTRREWAVYPGAEPWVSECPLDRGATPDPRVVLLQSDPRVGRVAPWGGSHTAIVRAVVLVDNREESLLLEDWTGYPWVRVPPTTEVRG